MEYEFESQAHLWAEVQNMLDSPGWIGYILPSLQGTLTSDIAKLLDPKQDKDVTDDFLRGRISMIHTLLNLPDRVAEHKQQVNEADLLGPDGQPVGRGDPYGANPGEGQPSTN